MLNRIVLIGRLTKDPELRYTVNGIGVASFTLAVDRNRKNQQGEKETDFINIVAWRGLGENCANYLKKGKLAAVDGRLQIRNYEDKEGIRRTITEVVADDVRFLSPKEDSASYGSGYSSEGSYKAEAQTPLSEDELPMTDDDLPF